MGATVLVVMVLAPACSDTAEVETTTTAAPIVTSTSPPTPTTQATTTTTVSEIPAGPALVPTIEIAGPEEVVWDWTTDRCEDEHIPDIAARAFRDAADQVQMIIGHYVNYRMIGPSIEELVTDCTGPILRSDFDADHTQFNDSEWIGSPYTQDGETVYAVVHNEYRGDTHSAARPGQCPSGDRLTCLDTSLTMVVSTDGGVTYDHIAPPPDHMIATLPYVYDDEGVPSGLRQPSNVIQGPDGYFYVFSNVSDYPAEDQWVCAMRTEDLSDPDSWRFWTGTDFSGVFVDPYTEATDPDTEKCAPLAFPQLSGGVNETVVYDEAMERYVMMGGTDILGGERAWGIHYATSDDLIAWTSRELLIELPGTWTVPDLRHDLFYAYPSVIDPDSASMNFETSDGKAYLYLTRFNAGAWSLDRDLVRFPIETRFVEVAAPDWEFDTDGDTEGWLALNAVEALESSGGSLLVRTIGDDPYLGTEGIEVPATYDALAIRMRVSGDGSIVTGQMFFGTDTDGLHTEDKSIVFDVKADGDLHEYVLETGRQPEWDGVIVSVRLDPVPDAGRTIEIDRIWFPEP